jgi:hypothetical protein
MAGYDPRIGSAFAALGYDDFPFDAFDTAGNPIIPPGIQLPPHYSAALGRIASAPVWSEIHRAISILDDRGWGCYMAGLAFVGDDVRVVIFKSLSSVPNADAAHEWARSYHETVERTVSDYAGTSHLVDPAWAKTINDVIGMLPEQAKKGDPKAGTGSGGSTDPGGKRPGGGTPTALAGAPAGDPSEPPAGAEAGREAFAVAPLLLLALRVMSAVLTTATVRTYVRSTVFWYTPAGWNVDLPWAGHWKPLHTLYSDGRRRSVHGIWNASGRAPAIIRGQSPPWRGPSVPDMPHDSWQWCRAFYPTAQCGGPAEIMGDGPLLVEEASTPLPT